MNIKKILALLGIVLAIVVIGIVIVTRKKDVRDGVDEKVLAKIAQEVWDEKPNEKGQKLICISRKDADDSQIEEEFFRRHNYNIGDYEDDHSFEDKIVPMITQQVMEKYGDVDLENDSEMSKTINAEINVALNEAKDEDVLKISIWEDAIENNGDDDIIPQESYQEDKDNEPKINFDAQYIRTGGASHEDAIIKVIHSVEELSAYYETNKDVYDLERREKADEKDTIGFLNACDRYDDEYFKNHVLVLVTFAERDSSIRHEVSEVYKGGTEEEVLYFINIKRYTPKIFTWSPQQRHVLLELEREVGLEDESQIVLGLPKIQE